MKTLPLTVLVHEGPIARAYLSRLRREGLRPERILLMVYSHHPATGRPIGRWLPRSLRTPYARRCQDMIQNFWPRRLRLSHPSLLEAMTGGLAEIVENPVERIDELTGGFRYEDHAGCVEHVLLRNLRDPALARSLTRNEPSLVLFTGGGLVPDALLEIPGARFLHVHPGRLPFVRGADGALWSALVRGQAGASCFYLAKGIDTGDVISTHDFPLPRFDLEGCQRPDDATLYRALFSFYDPLLRAECLARTLLESGGDAGRLRGIPQELSAGVTYHFMHPELRRVALGRLFVGERQTVVA